MKKIFLSIMFAAGIYSLAIGQQSSAPLNETWEKLGEKTVNLKDNHSVFNWNTDRIKTINANEMYSAIKFKAINEPVDLTNVEVQYGNGKKQDITLNSPVKANSESKAVNLDTKEKLDKITFNYKKENTAKKEEAKVEVWGLRAGTETGMGQGSKSSMGQTKSTTGQGSKSSVKESNKSKTVQSTRK
jgi:hypothetical protein